MGLFSFGRLGGRIGAQSDGDLRVGAAAIDLKVDATMPIAGYIDNRFLKEQEGELRFLKPLEIVPLRNPELEFRETLSVLQSASEKTDTEIFRAVNTLRKALVYHPHFMTSWS